jgi:hypothetical protein
VNEITEINNFKWQSLLEYLNVSIKGLLAMSDEVKGDAAESLQRDLAHLRCCLPFVLAMQDRQDMQGIIPTMSAGIIRLRCRPSKGSQVSSKDFAWVRPLEEGKFEVVGLDHNNLPEVLWKVEGDLNQTVEKIWELVRKL